MVVETNYNGAIAVADRASPGVRDACCRRRVQRCWCWLGDRSILDWYMCAACGCMRGAIAHCGCGEGTRSAAVCGGAHRHCTRYECGMPAARPGDRMICTACNSHVGIAHRRQRMLTAHRTPTCRRIWAHQCRRQPRHTNNHGCNM